jgi:hypothetical protein
MPDVLDRTELARANMTILRYLDVCLVLLTAPFVVAAGMPLMGYLIGACAWLCTRLGAEALHARAQRSRDVRVRSGLMVAVMMGRVWIVALAVLLARYAGGRGDGIMAAALVLAAFSVYLAFTLVSRGGPPALDRRSSHS